MPFIELEATPTSSGLEAAVVAMVTRYLAESSARPINDLYDITLQEEIVPPMNLASFSSLFISAQPTIATEHGIASNSLSTIHRNEEELIEIGFSENSLVSEEEKDNFQRYCCSISKRIMTEPVFDPRFTQFQFEKSEILRWLAIKQEHPFNRVNLSLNELVLNQPLKDEIDKFVDSTVAAFHQRAFSPK